jgi:U2 small nuclear ribonucleoprotein A'
MPSPSPSNPSYFVGHNIQTIENLGITRDLNDALDLTDNSIQHLTNFPLLPRLSTLLVANNRIRAVNADNIGTNLPNLRVLVLTRNQLAGLADLAFVATLPALEFFSALDNPCTTQTHYRAWLIWRNPGLRVIDFTRVRDAERAHARELFGESLAAPTDLARQILSSETTAGASKVFTTSTTSTGADGSGAASLQTLSDEDREKLREQLKSATSLDEISRIQRALRGAAAL